MPVMEATLSQEAIFGKVRGTRPESHERYIGGSTHRNLKSMWRCQLMHKSEEHRWRVLYQRDG